MKSLKKRLRNKKGFTLIELIVVIVVIGILAAILVPRFAGFSDSANKSADIATAKTLATAFTVLASEGDTTPSISEAAIKNLITDPGAPKQGGSWAFSFDTKGYPTSISAGGIEVWHQ